MIYVPTLSETQAKKSSPAELEMDFRRLAEENGLTAARIYQDVERYRAKYNQIEPSGS